MINHWGKSFLYCQCFSCRIETSCLFKETMMSNCITLSSSKSSRFCLKTSSDPTMPAKVSEGDDRWTGTKKEDDCSTRNIYFSRNSVLFSNYALQGKNLSWKLQLNIGIRKWKVETARQGWTPPSELREQKRGRLVVRTDSGTSSWRVLGTRLPGAENRLGGERHWSRS